MRPTVFQRAELRDENDNIIQQGTYGKGSALSNSTNDGWVDYVMNNLEALYGIAKDEVVPVSALPASGDMNNTYLLTTTGVCYRWDGTAWVEISSSEAVGRAETAANLAEQWATKTDGTVDGSEYSAKYYANAAQQSADDAQDVADDMATHLSQIDQNTGGVSANSKRITNIEKLLQGNLYDYQTDSTSAYTKSVPAGAMPYAGIEKVGGKTIVWNSLFNPATSVSGSTATIAYTSDGNGNITFTYGSYTPTTQPILFTIPVGHKIAVIGWTNSYNIQLYDGSGPLITQDGVYEAATYGRYSFRLANATLSSGSITLKPQVFDLTQMFGAGNEPTFAEFKAMFPASYYSYSAPTLLSAGVTEVVSKDSNNATLQTYSVPASIQALEGYGWSAGTAYNYVDFERKKFVQNVGRVDLGSLTWDYIPASNLERFATTIDGIKWTTAQSIPVNAITPTYVAVSYNVFIGGGTDKSMYGFTNNSGFVIRDTSYTDATAFKNSLSGVYLYYELAEPVETDISSYLTDDNLIGVDGNGTLTFPNSNGTDYQIPVPSEEEYMIDLQSAL